MTALLQHDEQPTALRDLSLRRAVGEMIDERKSGYATLSTAKCSPPAEPASA